MIFLGLGSNLVTDRHSSSFEILEGALNSLSEHNIDIVAVSAWYRSAPVPASDQPWFVNAVARVQTNLPPAALLAICHEIEAEFGRVRGAQNASRTLDLDLLAYDDIVVAERDGLVLPHPRLHERAFVLLPLAEVAPSWRHPVSGLTAAEMLAVLPPGQQVERAC